MTTSPPPATTPTPVPGLQDAPGSRGAPDPSGAPTRFACTGCGRCCARPPQLGFCEALAHHATFAFAGRITAVPASSPDAGTLAECGGVALEIAGERIVAGLDALVLWPGAAGRCPALAADGLCSLGQHRPSSCKALPLRPELPPGRQDEALSAFLAEAADGGFGCDWGSGAPTIHDAAGVHGAEGAAYAQARRDVVSSDAGLLRAMLSGPLRNGLKSRGLDVARVLRDIKAGGRTLFDPGAVVGALWDCAANGDVAVDDAVDPDAFGHEQEGLRAEAGEEASRMGDDVLAGMLATVG